MAADEQDLAWLRLNQESLDKRLERVENSLLFRSLRAAGRWVRPHLSAQAAYSRWRQNGGGTLPPPRPAPPLGGTYVLVPAEPSLAPTDQVSHAAQAHFAAAAGADLIYGDEELVDPTGRPLAPVFKPDWSPILLRSVPYLGGLFAIRRELLEGFATPRAALLAQPGLNAVHIPGILSASRNFPLPAAPSTSPPATNALVSVVICTRTATLLDTCLTALRANTAHSALEIIAVPHHGASSTMKEEQVAQVIARHGVRSVPFHGPFNFAAMNNLGASAALGELLLFLNDDVTPLAPDWLSRLAAWLAIPSIGAAGAKLTFPDGTLQHAGIAAWLIDGAWHPGRRVPESSNWPWNRYTREVSAVTGACLALRTGDFRRIGGFDPAFPVNFNDVDLCFRLRDLGLTIVIDVEARLQHDESRTRSGGATYEERRLFFRKWAHRLTRPDPYFTPHLAQNTEELILR